MLIVKGLGHVVAELKGISRYVVGKVGILGVVPCGFVGIVAGRMRRQPLDREPFVTLLLQLANGTAIDVQPVTEQQDWPARLAAKLPYLNCWLAASSASQMQT